MQCARELGQQLHKGVAAFDVCQLVQQHRSKLLTAPLSRRIGATSNETRRCPRPLGLCVPNRSTTELADGCQAVGMHFRTQPQLVHRIHAAMAFEHRVGIPIRRSQLARCSLLHNFHRAAIKRISIDTKSYRPQKRQYASSSSNWDHWSLDPCQRYLVVHQASGRTRASGLKEVSMDLGRRIEFTWNEHSQETLPVVSSNDFGNSTARVGISMAGELCEIAAQAGQHLPLR